eukprot:CAMPEP_0177719656 /NCGR_PEP_ID=MMETSP0484_2-20121128/16219_1 /TAXON_ID=354590 /ORGANISM="Rhodomonas lens, Strain RHODO" /LENGTH=239 /DNA_ID=CAMNT_0019231887 /DNA_START=25 /DNA_END=744 /DNA_ORIENTATION=+
MATLIRTAWKTQTQQDTFCELIQHADIHGDDHELPSFAPIMDNKAKSIAVSKWCKASAPAFVPVKKYSVVELLRMRAQASTHIQIDPIDYEGEDSPCVRSKRSPTLVAVEPIPAIVPLFVPLFVPPPAPKEDKEDKEDKPESKEEWTVVKAPQTSSDTKLPEQEKSAKRHRSRRGGRKVRGREEARKAQAPAQPEAEKKPTSERRKKPVEAEKKPVEADKKPTSVRRRRRAPAPAKANK